MRGHIDHYVDDDWSRTVEEMAGRGASLFKPILKKNPDFGYTQSKIWLRTRLINQTTDISEWRIFFSENFKQIFDVWILRKNGEIQNVLSLKRDSTFSERTIPYPELVVAADIAPGEEVTVLISLWSEGSSYIEFSVETVESFAMLAARDTAKNFIFYGMMVLLIVVALGCLALFRELIFLAYSGYAASALLYVMHADGVTFQYLWPNWPALNSMASVYAGSGIIIFGAVFSRVFIKTKKRHPIMDKVLLAVIFVTVMMNVVMIPTNPQMLKKALVAMSLVAIITFTLVAIIAASKRFREVRFYLFAWVGAVISATLLNLNHIFGFNIGQELLYDSMRGVMVFDAAMMGFAIADRYHQLRQSRQAALSDSLSKANRNIELSERLLELEHQHSVVSEFARNRDEHIQNTVHDLRQPIHALRISVTNLLRKQPQSDDAAANLEATFNYLEGLVAEQLSNKNGAAASSQSSVKEESDELGLQQVLGSIQEMFLVDAEEKGVELKFEKSDLSVPIDPLVLIRIVSNLVSNAIKYTDAGRVVIEVDDIKGALIVRVSDTGCGLSEDDFRRACDREVRLSNSGNSEGMGLGLAIAREYATKNGLQLRWVPSSMKGTSVELVIPKREPAVSAAI
ncbi:sensor histidine kinase [Pseudahrensia aquimaris]|uniref:histidine kinase n=1 Tax=Pseudahrensia aquimaris TaxID=744461 RepID=A0ABW3FFE2_9HYPH